MLSFLRFHPGDGTLAADVMGHTILRISEGMPRKGKPLPLPPSDTQFASLWAITSPVFCLTLPKIVYLG